MHRFLTKLNYIYFTILFWLVPSVRKLELPGGYRRIYFVHIRKTGGSSVNRSFLAMGDDQLGRKRYAQLVNNPIHTTYSQGRLFAAWNKRSIEEGHYFYAFSHLPFWKLKLPEDTYVFTCLRDPVKRVLSHYRMLLGLKAENSKHPAFIAEGPWLGDSLEDFLERCPREHLLNQLYTFSETLDVDEAVRNIGTCQFVLTTERLDQDLKKIEAEINVPLIGLHVRKGTSNFECNDETMKKLRDMLQPEYEFLSRIPEVADFYADKA